MNAKQMIGAVMLGAMAMLAGAGPVTDARIQDVQVFRGEFATVNSFIFSNGRALAVLDVQRKTHEARLLVEEIRKLKLPLAYILISHGHTDHFTGMAVVQQAFPDAKIVVASEDIKRAIKAYAVYMDTGGATGAEPALDPSIKPKSESYPQGFDYEGRIHVLEDPGLTLPGGGTLELTTDYKPSEADFMMTAYSPDLNALFLTDFGYHKVHLWLGDDISWSDIANWREEMGRIRDAYAARSPRIYPGHGEPTDMSLFDATIRYLDDYTRVAQGATSREQAMRDMIALYPDHLQADFFLKYSIENHVKAP